MKKRRIPRTDLEVSTLCLGTMTFGNPVGPKEAGNLIDWALDHGINFFDTADIYEGYDRKLGSAGGAGESLLGEALRGKREDAIIITKVGNSTTAGSGLGRSYIMQQIDSSLTRLQTDHVELYLLHRPDEATPLEDTLQTMVDLIAAGKILHWGFSNYDPPQIDLMVELCQKNSWPLPVISQPSYSWLNREIEATHLPTCQKHDIGVTPYRVLEGGLLTGKYSGSGTAPPEGSRATEHPDWLPSYKEEDLTRFGDEAAQANCTPAAYALQWPLQSDGVLSCIVGSKRPEQLAGLIG